jgi:hypothetical protein
MIIGRPVVFGARRVASSGGAEAFSASRAVQDAPALSAADVTV